MSDSYEDVAVEGLVLAGGAGRRVGGLDKGLINVAGRSAIEHIACGLSPCCDRIFVSANRHLQTYRSLSIGPVVSDLRPGHAGPLAGLEAVRPLVQAPILLVAPCDMPEIGSSAARFLLSALRADRDTDAVYARSSRGNHYLLAALRRRALCSVSAHLDAGQHAVRHWLSTLNSRAAVLPEDSHRGLRDRNEPRDWGAGTP